MTPELTTALPGIDPAEIEDLVLTNRVWLCVGQNAEATTFPVVLPSEYTNTDDADALHYLADTFPGCTYQSFVPPNADPIAGISADAVHAINLIPDFVSRLFDDQDLPITLPQTRALVKAGHVHETKVWSTFPGYDIAQLLHVVTAVPKDRDEAERIIAWRRLPSETDVGPETYVGRCALLFAT